MTKEILLTKSAKVTQQTYDVVSKSITTSHFYGEYFNMKYFLMKFISSGYSKLMKL